MVEEIIKDIEKLRDVSAIENCENLEEAKLLAEEMFKSLANQKTAPAIAANQIGINKKIIVLSVKNAIYLVNPVIVRKSMPTPYIESHASFPQKLFTVIRYASITVKADNIDGELLFGLKTNQKHLLYRDNKVNIAVVTHPVIMEAAYIQQTVDTLNGILPIDIEMSTPEPVSVPNPIGRNEIVTLTKDGVDMTIKFKKSDKFIQDGWKIK